jgi:hypothetical protein
VGDLSYELRTWKVRERTWFATAKPPSHAEGWAPKHQNPKVEPPGGTLQVVP